MKLNAFLSFIFLIVHFNYLGAEEVVSTGDSHPVLIVGETHGTNEFPAVIRRYASGDRVLIGLEIPHSEQQSIDRYLQSDGTASDRMAILSGEFWQPTRLQDGRSSAAVLDLIEFVRQRRHAGLAVGIFAFDIDQLQGSLELILPGKVNWTSERDAMMANQIEWNVRSYPGYQVVILVGSVHSILTRGAPWDPQYESMAYRLGRMIPVERIALVHEGGTAWTCNGPSADQLTCGEHPAQPTKSSLRVSGALSLGKLTAAKPASFPEDKRN